MSLQRVIVEKKDPQGGLFSPAELIRHVVKSMKPGKSSKTLHFVVHDGVSTEIDKTFVDDCIEDGSMQLIRWFREGSVLVMIYHWTN